MPDQDVPAATPVPRMSVSAASLSSVKSDLAIAFLFEADRPVVPGAGNGPLQRALSLVARQEGFRGKRREVLVWHSAGRFPSARYMLAGLGPKDSFSTDAVRDAFGAAARRATATPARTPARVAAALPAPPHAGEGPGTEAIAQAAAEGLALGAYRMAKYHTGEDARGRPLRAVELLAGRSDLAAARAGVDKGTLRAEAVNLARDIVNEPAIVITPMKMAEIARRIASQRGLEVKILEKKDLQRLGMGAILGIAAGSAQPPCLIHLTYRPRKPGRKKVPRLALVGKGLTFDSGGLSLKTASGMETMKLDKAGATAVLSAMSAVAGLAPAVEVHGIMGMTENMPGGSALKPGDILTSLSGKTIEVLNTDAEGRVVLADALAYAQRQQVDQIIDLATLTGACMVALGPVVSGAFGNDQEMMDRFLAAAREAGEKMWQLPLVDDYSDQLRSDVADLKNTPTSRYGGAITAGLFLKSFVENGTPWLHLDIAGPAFLESEQGYMRKGATGAAVRTLLTYIQSLSDA